MADIYQTDPNSYYVIGNGDNKAIPKLTGDKAIDEQLAGLTDEERQQYLKEANAPLTGEDVAQLVANSRATGYRPNVDEVQLYKKYMAEQHHDILSEIAQGFGHIKHTFMDAAGEFIQHPIDTTIKLPTSVAEGFFQGGRNLYGMVAEAQDPNSPLFRFKSILTGDGSDPVAEHRQFLSAMDFNNHSMDLEEGKTTLVMDKDLINHKVAIMSSYIADPTLVIPYVGEATGLAKAASAGMRAIGIGERMAQISAKVSTLQNKIIGGTLKWGIGTPLEFMGGAVRNTIDYGTMQSGRLVEAATGLPMSDWRAATKIGSLGTMAADAVGIQTGIPYMGTIGKAQLAGTFSQGLGGAISAIGDTMIRQAEFGRGVFSYAKQAFEDTQRAGIVLSPHAQRLLKVINAVDPLFGYSDAMLRGSLHGAVVGGAIGWGTGNVGQGIGAGLGLGMIGGASGKLMSDVSGATWQSRLDIQAKMALEGWKSVDSKVENHKVWSAIRDVALASGDKETINAINGYIAGIDVVAPDIQVHAFGSREHFTEWAERNGYDAHTKHFQELSRNFTDFNLTREERAKVSSILRDNGHNFAGDGDAFHKAATGTREPLTEGNFEQWIRDNHEVIDPSNKENNLAVLNGRLYGNGKELLTKEQRIDLMDRIKHLQEIYKEYHGKINDFSPENQAKADALIMSLRKERGATVASPIKPRLNVSKDYANLSENAKKAVRAAIDNHDVLIKDLTKKGTTLKDFYADSAAAEKFVENINQTHKSDANAATKKAKEILDAHRDENGKLNNRGELIKDKLRAEGYTDKDGNVAPRRNMNRLDLSADEFNASSGYTIRRESDGKVHLYMNMGALKKTTFPHELFHAIMRTSPMHNEFIKRLKTELLGTYDEKGNLIRKGSVNLNEVRAFMKRYVTADPAKRDADIDAAIKDYQENGTSKKLAESTMPVLDYFAEEFGAYYFSHWINSKPADYLFHGGELTGLRGMMDRVKDGWLDYWQGKMQSGNPTFDFSKGLDVAFGDGSGTRKRVSALDYFSKDFLRATANSNRGTFDPRSMSPEALRSFTEGNGIYTASERNSAGRTVAINEAQYNRNTAVAGREIFKVLDGLDPKLRTTQTIEIDGKRFIKGRFSEAELDAIVKSGHRNRAWADKHQQLYAVLDGKGSNVIEFGYLGRTAQIGDYSWPRLTGKQVPFKNRQAILLGIESHIGEDGTFHTVFTTLDKQVIDARGNDVWKNPQARDLWHGDRGLMEQDFFKYLENASLPADHPNRVSSEKLLNKDDGLGKQRRDWLHQMLGMAKLEGDVYINKPIAEIPLGIRHSVTSFNIDGATHFRVAEGQRYNYSHENAFRDLSRNFQPNSLQEEKTPNGRIIKHATGYRILETKTGNYNLIDPKGVYLSQHESIADAGRAAQKDYNTKFDAKVEGKDLPVPRTEIPPSRQAYIDNRIRELVDLKELKDKSVSQIQKSIQDQKNKHPSGGQVYDANVRHYVELLKSIEEKGLLKSMREDRVDVLIQTDENKNTWKFASEYIKEAIKTSGAEYDNMYPMEIKSALHGRLAQIMQDYPNLTAQGLLKKLKTYGSDGYRYYQEATEIGLVDLLESKIKPRTEIFRRMDAQGNPTGEVVTREIAPERRHTGELVGGTQTPLDMQEVLDFAKSKEIKVTIEEGAMEVNGMNTERFTLGGDKSNYKETAIRINPEYAHGVRGHYGEDTIVHFRTTERLDAEGNRVLYVEEVQANNTDSSSTPSQTELLKAKNGLNKVTKLKEEGLRKGVLVKGITGQIESNIERFVDGSLMEWRNGLFDRTTKEGKLRWGLIEKIDEVTRQMEEYYGKDYGDFKGAGTRIHNDIMDYFNINSTDNKLDISDVNLHIFQSIEGSRIREEIFNRLKLTTEYQDLIEHGVSLFNEYREWTDSIEHSDKTIHVLNGDNLSSFTINVLDEPSRLTELESDYNSIIQRSQATNIHPLTSAKDWTLSALKGIVRQAIRDGLDTITLTHPDDSPTVSNMKESARRGLYGKVIPEVWGAWLKKYGIEIAQQNRLANASIEFHKNAMAEVSSKLAEANQKVMDRFKQIGNSEDPDAISYISNVLSNPVHEMKSGESRVARAKLIAKIKDVEFAKLIDEALQLKSVERSIYESIQKIREEGIRGSPARSVGSNATISSEAIDRGMTFKLNDAIKRDFLDGRINTHAQPTEAGSQDMFSGGRKYDPNSQEWRTGFIGRYAEQNQDNIKDKNIEFVKRKDGSYRITMTDNSGETQKVGHITATIDDSSMVAGEGVAEISSNIDPKFRGQKLANVLYSEMAERLRAMGIKYVDGTIVNKDGIPVQVRNTIIGQTYFKGSNRPASREATAKKVQDIQSVYPNKGIGVYNELDPNAHYQPTESNGGFDFAPNSEKAYDLITEYLHGRRTGKPHEELMNPELNYVFENIEQFTKASNDDVIQSLEKLGAKGQELADKVKSGEITIRDASEQAKNIDEYGFLRKIKDLRDARKGLYKALLRTNGQMRGMSDNDARRYNTHAERESRNTERGGFQPAEEYGITPTEGFKWFKRNKRNNISKEREIVIDKILTDVFENKMSYAEAAKANNENRVNVAKLINNYIKNNPSALPLIPSEVIKSYKFKWYIPDKEAHSYPLSKAIKIDEAMDDVISKSMLIKDSAKKHSIDINVLTYAIKNARERGSQFEHQLGGVGSNTRSKELYELNKETGRMKISEENRKAIRSMYFDEGYSQKQVAQSFGLSKPAIQDILKEVEEKNKPSMQPAEGFADWKTERTSAGSIIKNSAGYIIVGMNSKWKVYNPYRAVIGIYDDENKAKQRVLKEGMKR